MRCEQQTSTLPVDRNPTTAGANATSVTVGWNSSLQVVEPNINPLGRELGNGQHNWSLGGQATVGCTA